MILLDLNKNGFNFDEFQKIICWSEENYFGKYYCCCMKASIERIYVTILKEKNKYWSNDCAMIVVYDKPQTRMDKVRGQFNNFSMTSD